MRPEGSELVYLLVSALRNCHGEGRAVTLKALAEFAGVSRREVENTIEKHLEEFPFVVVSGAHGYFRPQSAEEINHYQKSLESRIMKMWRRKKTVRKLARESGFIADGKVFVNPPAQQFELSFNQQQPAGGNL